jgi:ABC-type lipoprotein export system ATPase subunit
MCSSVAIGMNKLSHLPADRVSNSCVRKVRNIFQLFNLVKNSTKEERVQSPDRFKRQLPSSVSPSQKSSANRKVFRIGLHATASKYSPRKALFSSVQEQSQHQPKNNFLEEHINVSNLFEINETQVLKGLYSIVYPSDNAAILILHDKQSPLA